MCLYQHQIVNLMYYLIGIININLDIMIISLNGQGKSLKNMWKMSVKSMGINLKYLELGKLLKMKLMLGIVHRLYSLLGLIY